MSKAPLLLAASLPCYGGLFYWATNHAAELPQAETFPAALNLSTNPLHVAPGPLANIVVLRPSGDPPPGVYSAKPYSMLVLVPGPSRSRMVRHPASNTTFSGKIIKPPLRLEPLNRK